MTALVPLPNMRELYPAGPPDVRLDTVGPWCPLDDCRLDCEVIGWCCTRCGAGWDFQGRAGQWLGDGTELTVRLWIEDAAEDAGLAFAERSTCRLCRTWMSKAHTDGNRHQATVAAAVASARQRRVNRRVLAGTIAVSTVSAAGYVAGQASRDAGPLLPDVWLWAIAAVIGGGALLALVVAAINGWRERRRYAHNELLDPPGVAR